MFKRVIVGLLLIVAILFGNSLIKLEYDMNIYEYLTSNDQLTDEEFQYLKEQGTLIYGADHNSPPLRYVNENTGQYEGLSIDYFSALSMELGVNIEFQPLMWSDALKQLKTGEIDLCDMYPSAERAKDYLFSNPIYYLRGAILVKKSNTTIQSVKDLENKTISGTEGDFVFEYINQEFDHVATVEASDLNEAIVLLTEGKVDAVLGDESVMNYLINKEQLKNDYIILNDYLYEREAVLAVQKGNDKLIRIFNKAISNLNKKQTLENINNKWFGSSPLITKGSASDKVLLITRYVLILIALFVIGLYAWNIQLKREVLKQTTQLRVSKNELETVFNGLTHLMIVIDENCQIVDGNKTFCEKYQLNHDHLYGKHCKDINGILGSQCHNCIIIETFKSKQSQTREIKNGTRIYNVSTYVLKQVKDMKQNILVMMEDVTDFRINEDKMLQSTKMAAIGQLAAGIAHEIRTPLGIIRNNLYYMKRSKDPAEHLESLAIIESSVARSNKIIDNLLNFSKLTDNEITKTNINDLIQNIALLNKKFFTSRKINLNISCPSDLIVDINAESFKHVMINLINNAVDAIIDGGDLTIDVSVESDEMLVKVIDTGKGMSQQLLNKIFDPFYTTKEQGTGLGLYITYNEVQKIHGTIYATSTEEIGTTFNIIIPTEGYA